MNIRREEIEKIRKIPMLFILGKGRSGTSLLQNLLDTHPQVIGGPESKFAVVFYPKFGHIKNWKKPDIVSFVEHLFIEPLFAKLWHLDKAILLEDLLAAADIADYALLCKMVYYQMRKGKENVLYISDKNPEYILYINTIVKIFPEAKFIHIVREPRDNVYSQITSFHIKNTVFRAYQWVGYNSIVEEKKKKEPGNYLTVIYENLVEDTEGTMMSVCQFLKIPFVSTITQNTGPEWLNAHAERTGITDKEQLAHRNLLKPIDTSNIGKWKNKMEPYDQIVTEVITGNFAKKMYGYDIDGNKKNKPIEIPAYTLIKGKYLYYLWQKFTRAKMKSFRFNLFYSKVKRRISKNVPTWEYF